MVTATAVCIGASAIPATLVAVAFNDAPGGLATKAEVGVLEHQIIIKMRDDFAISTAQLAKVRVWFNNLTVFLDFFAILS